MAGLNEKKRAVLRSGCIGFIFQNFNLIDELTVYENVEMPLLYLNVPARGRRKKVEDLLTRMDILHRRKHFPQQLSGGQQQRAAVARAIITDPHLILADEPTGNLDSKNGEEVMEIIREMHKKERTIVMVTHSPGYADYADRIIHLFDGRLVTEDSPEACYV